MNRVILTGRLTRDPEAPRKTNSDRSVLNITIAVDRPGKDAGADFIRVQLWGTQADNAYKYLSKGRQVAIEGYLRTGSYEKDGKTNYTMDVVANNVEYLGTGGNRQANNSGGSKEEPAAAPADNADDSFAAMAEDIPF